MRKLAWARRGESISPLGEPKGPLARKEDDYLISHDKPMVDIDFEDEGLITVQASPAATVARVALGDDDEEYDLDNLVSRE
ncbi:TPA: hypothetical protein ACH3X2_005828 [Trebouxia sp. C0005]